MGHWLRLALDSSSHRCLSVTCAGNPVLGKYAPETDELFRQVFLAKESLCSLLEAKQLVVGPQTFTRSHLKTHPRAPALSVSQAFAPISPVCLHRRRLCGRKCFLHPWPNPFGDFLTKPASQFPSFDRCPAKKKRRPLADLRLPRSRSACSWRCRGTHFCGWNEPS